MSRRNTEPVRHTCPDIDRIISSILSICKEIDHCDTDDSVEDLLSQMRNWESDLESIARGNNCDLENLRSSNSALREWGQEMYNEAENLESEVYKLNDQISELESVISELKDTLVDLEDEISMAAR